MNTDTNTKIGVPFFCFTDDLSLANIVNQGRKKKNICIISRVLFSVLYYYFLKIFGYLNNIVIMILISIVFLIFIVLGKLWTVAR